MENSKLLLKLHNSCFLDNKNISYFNGLNIKKIYFYNEIAYLILLDSVDIYEVFEIGVLKEYRNKGIASKLIEKIPTDREVFLEVSCDNISAIKLYEKTGFKKISIRKNYYEGKTAIIMKK